MGRLRRCLARRMLASGEEVVFVDACLRRKALLGLAEWGLLVKLSVLGLKVLFTNLFVCLCRLIAVVPAYAPEQTKKGVLCKLE